MSKNTMDVSVETLEGIARKLTITVDADTFDSTVNAKFNAYAKSAKVPGFRKGKVPKNLMQQNFGGAALKEAIDALINEYYPKALQQEEINPASLLLINPTQAQRGKPFIMEVDIEVYPEVGAPDLKGESIEVLSVKVEKADVDRTIESIAKRQMKYDASGKAAKKGDQIIMDFVGTIDGEVFSGGEAKDASLILGEGRFMEAFEKNLSGVKPGDEKKFEVEFPKDYHGAEVAGKTAEFAIVVNQVNVGSLPKIDDDFAKAMGVEGGVKKMRDEIKAGLEREMAQKLRNHTRDKVFEALESKYDFPLPQALVEEETSRAVAEITSQLEQQGMPSTSVDRNNYKAPSERRVKLGLLVRAVAEKENIAGDEKLLEQRIQEMAGSYSDPKEFMQHVMKDESQKQQMAAAVMEEQVVNYLLSTASSKEVTQTYEAFMQG